MTLTTGGLRFFADNSHGGDPLTWEAQRLLCWQKANPSGVVNSVSYPQNGWEVPNPIPAGLVMQDGGTDYSTLANSGWQYFFLNASQVSTVDPNTCGKSNVQVLKPWQFPVSAYGAVGDGDHDDTAAINACHADAFAYAGSHGGVYSVVLDALTYHIAGAPSTSHQGNAQLPWPYVTADSAPGADTGLKIGGGFWCPSVPDQSMLYHWLQKVPQNAGAVLKSTYDAGNSIPGAGEASVIGGPTLSSPPAHWSNVLATIDNVQISVPNEPNVCGIDLRCFGQAYVKSAGVLAAQTPGVNGPPNIPSPKWAFGLAMPYPANNARCDIDYFSCEGLTYGLIGYEHLSVKSLRLVNNYTNLIVWSNQSTPHQNLIEYACLENAHTLIETAGSTGKLIILMADIEWGTGPIFVDACSTPAHGEITIGSNGTDGQSLNDALNGKSPFAANAIQGTTAIRLINSDQAAGPIASPPAVPATATPFKNPFYRDATVIVSGTVTGISVNGTQVATAAATVTVPTNQTITLTYSGAAPSWSWTLT